MNNQKHTENYFFSEDSRLKDYPTRVDLGLDNKGLKKELNRLREELAAFQDKLYAHGKYGVLVCLQGMDTAGKDSLIREVFKEFNVRGVVVHSFKVPTSKELKHDYLWRHYVALPERGKFSVFNRTHYENVLVTRVHPEYLLYENLPHLTRVEQADEKFWADRFRQIRDFERHISENGVKILKFYLHLSKDEQRNRLLRRLEKEEKNWKFSPGDLNERKLWEQYENCYQEALSETSTEQAPWYCIPADDKRTARVLVASILQETLTVLDDVQYPQLEEKVARNIENFKEVLNNEE
ncbi:PPK2 family polyphosphate kinase [Aureicoccus marinus]|uniref:Phosphate--nucleotide phosphotransferase n=1 Tax=Aureicoccus marinus TaxID=754435 RepID=A0A2S7T3V1_9FLAO|nr:PPK2 family polyphosphate kinase [Aureicoccus marinus]PQJ14602.1 phosphate--nucleotide phosphotransferase [Aureicoccus marinus]